MPISDENPHREYFETHQLTFWKKGAATGRSDADRCDVQQFYPGFGMCTIGSFDWPQEQHKVDRLAGAIGRSFEAGKVAKVAELRNVIGL